MENLNAHYETEHKFLIKLPDINLLEKKCTEKIKIVQTYLVAKSSEVERRVREMTIWQEKRYYYTEKADKSYGVRRESEREISVYEYEELLREKDSTLFPIYKTRYVFNVGKRNAELDVYSPDDKFAIAEVETDDISEEVYLPEFVEMVREVAGEKCFSNRHIAKTGKLVI